MRSSPAVRTARGCERRLLAQNRRVKLLERGARLDSQLVDEHAAGFLVGAERFGLAPRAVEREHQLAAEPLAERILLDEPLELSDELGCRATFEIGLDSLFEGSRPKLLEAGDLGLGERLESEVGKRRSSPERERLPELLVASLGLERPCPGNEPLELVDVDLLGGDVQEIAGRLGDDHFRAERSCAAAR